MKSLLCIAAIFFIFFSFSATALALPEEEQMHNVMGQAYKAAAQQKTAEAKELFNKAAELAEKTKNWEGLLAAGYGLSTLGNAEGAKKLFDQASLLAEKTNDWRIAIGLGYAYASLPDSLTPLPQAEKLWQQAKQWSEEKEDIFGLIETGRAWASINKNKEAENCLAIADKQIKETPSQEAVKTLAETYRKLGKEDKATCCESYLRASTAGAIPPACQPTAGETVRAGKSVSSETQTAQRTSAFRDIADQETWQRARNRQKQQEKMQRRQLAYQTYRDYLNYYSYPYYGIYSGVVTNPHTYYTTAWCPRPVWCRRTHTEICNWASWQLGYYSYRNGVYVRIRAGKRY